MGVPRVSEELWDVVDAKGRALGRTTPRSAPRFGDGEYHLVVGACVLAADGRMLVTRRAPGKTWPGWWEFPAGSALAGEPGAAAAQRELAEETGIVLPVEGFVHLLRAREAVRLFDLFAVEVESVPEVVPQAGEVDDWAWMDADAVFGTTRTVAFAPPWLPRLDAVESLVRDRIAWRAGAGDGQGRLGTSTELDS